MIQLMQKVQVGSLKNVIHCQSTAGLEQNYHRH